MLQYGMYERGGGAFSLRAGDVDSLYAFMRVSEEGREFAYPVELEGGVIAVIIRLLVIYEGI
jgi:hypothetical protein